MVGEASTIEASSASLSSVVASHAIEQLPLNGRDYTRLAVLDAGATIARSQSRNVNNGWGLQISLAGGRPYQNNYRLDGLSLNAYHNSTPGSANGISLGVEAIREFSVMTASYSAQYGRAAGGILNAVTRSGSNSFHGSAYYFHRNDNFDARNFFDPGETPEFRRHQLGAALGGPISHNRAFFFANYEALLEQRGNTAVYTLSPKQRAAANWPVAQLPSIPRSPPSWISIPSPMERCSAIPGCSSSRMMCMPGKTTW